MKRYSTLLFDADMTLFDFEYAEEQAFYSVMEQNGISCGKTEFMRYQAINAALWERFGRGEISKAFLRSERFTAFLKTLDGSYTEKDGIVCGEQFVVALSACSRLLCGAAELCRKLSKTHSLYLVTNGISAVQHPRFEKSEIFPYFDGIFVSEDAGAPKPDARYFDYVFSQIGEEKRRDSVIIGDSLESDVRGGEIAGIDSIWYNPQRKLLSPGVHPTAEVADFDTLYRLLTLD